jgi:hypothetical protein
MNAVATTMPAAPVARTETRGEPLSGDVVVSPDPEAPGRFTICQVPGSPSIWWGSRSKAVDVAQRFARAHRVDLWFDHRGSAERLHAYRSTSRRSH